MKVKLDENLPLDLQLFLTSLGHDTHTVPDELLTGQPDTTILDAARIENRMLITRGLDFSDSRQLAPGSHPGIIILRLHHPSQSALTERLRQVLSIDSLESWQKCLVIITDHRIRIRR
jgi:predicted nuclease of predicted toxin-antitoxin system